ncbi:hypothetical protein KNE206_38300 [Kitasatospora sp. NE20-6]|uniref:DUF5709 domain-containing protein n=1 Tax=Kitasatospora sp. NE20-6 TaxID=2859066 RepID=UPI0034DC4926
MSSGDTGDDVHQPDGGEPADATPPDLENALDERDYDDVLDEGHSPPERPLGVDRPGTTAAEQHEGETLDQRLAQEVPDVGEDAGDGIGDLSGGAGEPRDREVGDARAGRLVAPDEGAHGDTEKELWGTDVGIDAGAAGAEEAAVHVIPAEDTADAEDTGADLGALPSA